MAPSSSDAGVLNLRLRVLLLLQSSSRSWGNMGAWEGDELELARALDVSPQSRAAGSSAGEGKEGPGMSRPKVGLAAVAGDVELLEVAIEDVSSH